MRFSLRQGGQRSIRTRVLAIVLVPCLALVAVGVTAAAVLVKRGIEARTWADTVRAANFPTVQFLNAVQEERRLSLLRLAGDTVDSTGLEQVRPQVDASLAELGRVGASLTNTQTPEQTGAFNALLGKLPTTRAAVDAGKINPTDAFTFYDGLIQSIGAGLFTTSLTARDPQTAAELSAAVDAFDVLDAMTRANADGAGSLAAGGFTAPNLQYFDWAVTYYRIQITVVAPRLAPHGQSQVKKLMAGLPYTRLGTVEQALILRGPKPARIARDPRPLPGNLSFVQWQKDAEQVANGLQAIWVDQLRGSLQGASDRGQRSFVRSLLAGLGILILAGIALAVAIRLSNSLVRRLKRLRADTLELADERLPRVVESLRTGKAIDLATDVPDLEYGRDEVGQVASAFNKAQRTAVAAAQQEAQAREGMSAVFLNIAHRSQMVAHRQLEVLDEAERKQEDPKHLELLFRIDHLATRARRNAENLVILGGERPGRKWRNPVPLDEIARGAVSETENFARVSTVRIPEVLIEGGMVADLIHLIAELVDNATSFSPPGTRVEVRGNMVGRGVVIEVEDQGLGMTEAQRDRLNAMMHDPPDFQVMALSRQMRLGLFVVAQLAHRHEIRVTLAESAYGGTRAIVLIPSAPANVPSIAAGPTGQGELPALPSHQHQLYAPARPGRPTALTAGNGLLPGAPVEWAREHGYGEDGFPVNGNGNGSNGSNGNGSNGNLPFLPPPMHGEPARVEPAPDGPRFAPAQFETLSSEPPAPLPSPVPLTSPVPQPVPQPALRPEPVTGETPVAEGPAAPAEPVRPEPVRPEPILPQIVSPQSTPLQSTPLQSTPPQRMTPPDMARPDMQRPAPPVPSFQPFPPAGNGTGQAAQPAQPAQAAHAAQHRHAGGARTPLPRRRRQANLAPQLAADLGPAENAPAPDAERSPEQARDTLAAVLRGTREARQNPPAEDQQQ